MANFATKLFLCFVMLTVHSVGTQGQGTAARQANRAPHGLVSRYITKLYNTLTNQTNQSRANASKIPFNATAVRAMFFSSIQSKRLLTCFATFANTGE